MPSGIRTRTSGIMVNVNVTPASAPAVATFTATYLSTTTTGPSSFFTFNNVALGDADSNRQTVFIVSCINAVSTGATVGGLGATLAVQEASGISNLQIWSLNTTSLSTTATIVVTGPAGQDGMQIQVARITGCTSAAINTTTVAPNNSDPASITGTVPSGGFGVAGLAFAADNHTQVWTNAITDFNDFSTNSNLTVSMGHNGTAGAQVISMTNPAAASNHLVYAAWSP